MQKTKIIEQLIEGKSRRLQHLLGLLDYVKSEHAVEIMIPQNRAARLSDLRYEIQGAALERACLKRRLKDRLLESELFSMKLPAISGF